VIRRSLALVIVLALSGLLAVGSARAWDPRFDIADDNGEPVVPGDTIVLTPTGQIAQFIAART